MEYSIFPTSADYAKKLSQLTEALENQKQEQLEALRQQLIDKRRRAKKALHRTHLDEAQAMGFPSEVVPEITIPSHETLEHDLQMITQEQAKLIADRNLAAAKQLDGVDNDVSNNTDIAQRWSQIVE